MIKAMPKIDWDVFYKSFQKVNKHNLDSKQISKRGQISTSYCKQILAKPKKHQHKMITLNMVEKIGQGIGLQPNSSKNWAKQLKISNQAKHRRLGTKSSKPNLQSQDITQLVPLAHYLNIVLQHHHQSVEDIAKQTYVNQEWLHQMLSGKRPVVSKFTLMQLATGLKVPFTKLMAHNHQPSQKVQVQIKKIHQKSQQHKFKVTQRTHITVANLVNKLNPEDQELIKPLVLRLLHSEHPKKN